MQKVQQEKARSNTPISSIFLDSPLVIRIAMGAKLPPERALMERSDVWHKFKVLKGGLYDKEIVLKSILRAIDPYDLIPIKYQAIGEDAYFVARKCAPALEMLCKLNMIVRNDTGEGMVLAVTLGFTLISDLRVHLQPILLEALTKRYNPDEKTLDLEHFHTDSVLEESVYYLLSQLRNFTHVLQLAKAAIATFEHLNLRRNELFDISAIENASLKSIRYLDLRHNNLLNMNALTPLKNLEIIKLWLDDNPLCENYSTAKQYVESAKRYCPHLQELDGVCIAENMPMIYKDYFPNDSTQRFAQKFINHFFNLFDQVDRTVLRGLYHRDAFYSMSFAIPHDIAQKNSLNLYLYNRNLKKNSKKARNPTAALYRGQEDILVAFSKLPRSYHDKDTFTYDILYDTDKVSVFSVTGLFKKLSFGTNVLSFSRTFVLVPSLDNEYHILNDQYYIFAAPENVTPDKIIVKYTFDENELVCFSPGEKAVLITRMQQVTKMNKEFSETYLLKDEWNMRKALYSFMKDLKESAIPKSAFVPSSQ